MQLLLWDNMFVSGIAMSIAALLPNMRERFSCCACAGAGTDKA